MTYLNYFAYGSNMFAARLGKRVRNAEAIGAYTLRSHELRFHKRSKDGSGKCDACETGDREVFVAGRLFRIPESEEAALNEAEGLHHGYEKKTVTVVDSRGNEEQAFTYYATDIETALRPFSWYKEHVLAGAREAALPADYVRKIEAFPAYPDPNRERTQAEMKVHPPGAMAGRIVLISCAAGKLPRRAKAEDLYTSTLFELSLRYARTLRPDEIFILSAKHGLLPLEREIDPYEQTLNTMRAAEVRAWAGGVRSQLNDHMDGTEVVFLAGDQYRKHLLAHFRYPVAPLRGLRIGEQLQKLKELCNA